MSISLKRGAFILALLSTFFLTACGSDTVNNNTTVVEPVVEFASPDVKLVYEGDFLPLHTLDEAPQQEAIEFYKNAVVYLKDNTAVDAVIILDETDNLAEGERQLTLLKVQQFQGLYSYSPVWEIQNLPAFVVMKDTSYTDRKMSVYSNSVSFSDGETTTLEATVLHESETYYNSETQALFDGVNGEVFEAGDTLEYTATLPEGFYSFRAEGIDTTVLITSNEIQDVYVRDYDALPGYGELFIFIMLVVKLYLKWLGLEIQLVWLL